MVRFLSPPDCRWGRLPCSLAPRAQRSTSSTSSPATGWMKPRSAWPPWSMMSASCPRPASPTTRWACGGLGVGQDGSPPCGTGLRLLPLALQLWHELCDLISQNPDKVQSLNVDAIIRGGLTRFTDQLGKLWCSLADYYIRSGHFEKVSGPGSRRGEGGSPSSIWHSGDARGHVQEQKTHPGARPS